MPAHHFIGDVAVALAEALAEGEEGGVRLLERLPELSASPRRVVVISDAAALVTVDNYLDVHKAWFAWAAKQISKHALDPVLIAIPNSGATPEKANFATRDLAIGISEAGGKGWPIYDGLRFAETLQPSSKGGRRDKEYLLRKMLTISDLPAGAPVLIDDVCTGGGHLFAAQRRLALPDGTHCIVCGRTVHERLPKMVGNIHETISASWWMS